ncbi:MAG: hypothetical protein JWN86_3095 [Planctomycetota bacterium]|nr:hypothetical protein [Planctomycetota bacterium]
MEYFTEDPTYLATGLGILALVFLVMMKATQQGRYLIYAGAALGVLALLLVVERLYVTENERIEDVVYGLAKAVEASDGDGAAEFLTPDCVLERSADQGNIPMRLVTSRFAGPLPPDKLKEELENYTFDYLKVTRLHANAGKLSGMGTAEFAVHTMGQQRDPFHAFATPPAGMGWSFGLREVSPQVWKVARITPGRMDRN